MRGAAVRSLPEKRLWQQKISTQPEVPVTFSKKRTTQPARSFPVLTAFCGFLFFWTCWCRLFLTAASRCLQKTHDFRNSPEQTLVFASHTKYYYDVSISAPGRPPKKVSSRRTRRGEFTAGGDVRSNTKKRCDTILLQFFVRSLMEEVESVVADGIFCPVDRIDFWLVPVIL